MRQGRAGYGCRAVGAAAAADDDSQVLVMEASHLSEALTRLEG